MSNRSGGSVRCAPASGGSMPQGSQQQDVRMFHGFVYGFAVPKLRNFFGIRTVPACGPEVNFAGEQAEDPKKIDYIRTIKTARLIGKRDFLHCWGPCTFVGVQAPWPTLFNGRNLKGWKTVGGTESFLCYIYG